MRFIGKGQDHPPATGGDAGPTQLRARELIPRVLLWFLVAGMATLVALDVLYRLVVATCLAWGLALYVTGALAGFLFGIPKVPDVEIDTPGRPPERKGRQRRRRAGVLVHLVRRGDEALQALERTHYDVLVTDMMRKENTPDNLPAGLSLLKRLQDLPAGAAGAKPVAIVYCGKRSQLVYGRTATELGAFAVTSSPVEMLSLLARLIPGFEA